MSPPLEPFVSSGKKAMIVIDPSASHLAWCLCTLNLDAKEFEMHNCSMIWTHDSWSRGIRYNYMYKCLEYLLQGTKVVTPTLVVTEAFFANPKLLFNSAVIPIINALIEMHATTLKCDYKEIGPPSWRSILGIKAIKVGAKKDFKKPTADEVRKYMEVPEMIQSNISRKDRQTPHDVTDVLAIALSIAKLHGIHNVSTSPTCFFPFTHLDKFKQLANEV